MVFCEPQGPPLGDEGRYIGLAFNLTILKESAESAPRSLAVEWMSRLSPFACARDCKPGALASELSVLVPRVIEREESLAGIDKKCVSTHSGSRLLISL